MRKRRHAASPQRPDVLIYGMNFMPEMTGIGRYSGEMAVGLTRRGLNVDAITTAPHYPGWYVRVPYSPWKYSREVEDGVRILRCPMLLRNAGSGIGRLLAPISFAVTSAPVALWRILRDRPRTIVCVEPTLFVVPVALLAAKMTGARTVLHVQDLEVDAAFAIGHLGGRAWLRWLGFAFERFLTKRFDLVVTISQQMAKRLVLKGVVEERVRIIRNWVDTSRIFPLGRPSRYRDDLRLDPDQFVVVYSGQIGPKQALHAVLEAAERLADDSRIHFVLVGDGPYKSKLANRFGHLRNVTLLDLQPEHLLNELLNLADCHVLPQHPSVADLVLPSKLGGMLASGKPALVVADDESELAAFLGDSCVRLPSERLNDLDTALLDMLENGTGTDEGSCEMRLHLARTLAIEGAISAFEILVGVNRGGATGMGHGEIPGGAS